MCLSGFMLLSTDIKYFTCELLYFRLANESFAGKLEKLSIFEGH